MTVMVNLLNLIVIVLTNKMTNVVNVVVTTHHVLVVQMQLHVTMNQVRPKTMEVAGMLMRVVYVEMVKMRNLMHVVIVYIQLILNF